MTPMPTETVADTAPPAVDPDTLDPEGASYAQQLARDAYLESVEHGRPLTGEQLGKRFDRSGRWGRDRIAETRPSVAAETLAEPVATADATADAAGPAAAPAAPAATPAATPPPATATATATKPAATRRGNGSGNARGNARGKAAPRRRATTANPPTPATATLIAAPPPTRHRWWQRIDGARLVAWSGFAFGSAMSVAANVLYTWLPADTHPAGWQPPFAQQVGAAVWPIALLISVEVLTRVQWRSGFWWGVPRFGGAGLVAVASGGISYVHLHEVLVKWGYGYLPALAGPIVLDGLMVVSGFALLAMAPHHTDRKEHA